MTAPEVCWRALRGVCLGVATRDVSQLAEPSRKLAREEARAVVEKLGLLGTVRRRGVSGTNIGVRNNPRRKQLHAEEQNHDMKTWAVLSKQKHIFVWPTHLICWAFCFPALKPGGRSELELLKPNERVQQRKQMPCWLRGPTCRCAVPRDCGGLQATMGGRIQGERASFSGNIVLIWDEAT